MLRLFYLRCQCVSDNLFQQFLRDWDSLAGTVNCCGRKSAVKRGAKFLEHTIFHQLLAVTAVDLAFQRILVFCVVPGLVVPVLQHNDLLRLFKFLRGHNGGMAVLNSYLLFQGSAQDPTLTGNRHNEFRAHIGSLILLIFQNMVNRSTCPMAALQIPCFLLTVHMVFRHVIRCRSWNLLFVQDFCDGACSVALQCQFKNQAHILAGYRVKDQLMAIVRVRQESEWAVSSEIHSFFLHHMVCCRDFSGKVPAVGCVDDVLDGHFQSAHIVSDLSSAVIPIVDGDKANAQQWKDALHVIACLNVITGEPGKVLYDNRFHFSVLRILN